MTLPFRGHHFHVMSAGLSPSSSIRFDITSRVITSLGGALVMSTFDLLATARSLSRKGERMLFVVALHEGTLSLSDVETAIERRLLNGTRSDVCSHVEQLRRYYYHPNDPTANLPQIAKPIGVVSFVSHRWVSECAAQFKNRGEGAELRAASQNGFASIHDLLELCHFDQHRIVEHAVNGDVPLHVGNGVNGIAADVTSPVPPATSHHKEDQKASRSGFIPLFFAGSSDGPPSAALQQGGVNTETSVNTALSALTAIVRKRHRRGVHIDNDSDAVSSEEEEGDNHMIARRRQPNHLHSTEDVVTWCDAEASSDDVGPELQMIGPGHIASAWMARNAAWIDKTKPFVCQRPFVAEGAKLKSENARTDETVNIKVEGEPLVPRQQSNVTPQPDRNVNTSCWFQDSLPICFEPLEDAMPAMLCAPDHSLDFKPNTQASPSHDGGRQLNQALLTELAKLMAVYESTGDQWRKYAYSKAIGVIKRVPFEVERVEQLAPYRGLGDRILNKVREILATGSTTKLHVLQATPHVKAMEEFTKIWGVGPTTAKKLATHPTLALTDIASLRACPELESLLTPIQLAGLRHYENLQVRIPREEVTLMIAFVKAALTRVVGHSRSEQVDVIACGSYRRGKASSGDVDILLCDRNTKRQEDGLLARLVAELKRPRSHSDGNTKKQCSSDTKKKEDPSATPHCFVVEDLTVSYRSLGESHSDTWFGIVQLPDCDATESPCPCSHHHSHMSTLRQEGVEVKQKSGVGDRFDGGVHLTRRLDLKLYPEEQFAFAMLYFTGSDYFNRSMRLYCQKKGWSLSDKELKPVVRTARGLKIHETAHGVMCKTEREIFDVVGLPWREPHERDV